jgi:hypothetical protein
MIFYKDDIYFYFHICRILFEFSNDELFIRIWCNQIEWFEININSIKSKLISYMFCRYIF